MEINHGFGQNLVGTDFIFYTSFGPQNARLKRSSHHARVPEKKTIICYLSLLGFRGYDGGFLYYIIMKHLDIALKEYGQKEIAGDKHNPRIVQYSQDIGNTWVRDDEVAWCSEFVNWCLLQAGIPGTKSAVARSFHTWGEETKTPQLGDIVVFAWTPTSGHIGFFINETPTTVRVLGGNQNDEVNIKSFEKKSVLSYRKVPSQQVENTAILSTVVTALQAILEKIQGKK